MSQIHNDFEGALRRVGGAWGWFLTFGILGIAAGLTMFFFTGQALYVIAIAFGVWLIVTGVFRFVGAFAIPAENGWLRALYALLSAIAVTIGVYLLAHPVLSLILLTVTVGFFWIFSGMMELFVAIGLNLLPHRGWAIAGGLLGMLAGWTLIFFPGISTLTLALLFGCWLVAYGLITVIGAFRIRAATRFARAVLSPRHA